MSSITLKVAGGNLGEVDLKALVGGLFGDHAKQVPIILQELKDLNPNYLITEFQSALKGTHFIRYCYTKDTDKVPEPLVLSLSFKESILLFPQED